MIPDKLPPLMRAKLSERTDCWLWTGAVNSKGYPSMTDHQGGTQLAHRRSYELLVGPIPEGLTIDHLCRVKLCLNPAHMEPVTRAENNRRAWSATTHCKRGHAKTPENTYETTTKHGRLRRECKVCRREIRRAQRRAA